MKKLIVTGLLAVAVLFQSCTYTEVPQPVTNEFLAEVFEVKADFNNANEYRNYYKLDPIIYDSDVLLVYELSGIDNKGGKIWKALPQVYTLNEGIMQYNFDFSKIDFSIFLDSTFDPMKLNSSWRINKTFRVVIVPGKFSHLIDKKDLNSVMNTLNLTENSVVDLIN